MYLLPDPPDIEKIMRTGSLYDEPKTAGRCTNPACKEIISEDWEAWTDNDKNLFCTQDCAIKYYGIEEIIDWENIGEAYEML